MPASELTEERIAELRRLEKAATEERTTSGMRVRHLDYVLALVDAAPALLDAAEETARLRDLVCRYRAYHDGVARCESAEEQEECLCGVCTDARAALEAKHAGK
jgi:hypothetical protein